MEKIKITHNDKKWFYTYLNNESEVEEVCDYLKKTRQVTKIEKIDTPNYYSCRVFLDGVDLSVNGNNFRGENLLNHVRIYPHYLQIINSEEYKNWDVKYHIFNEIKTYINARKK